MIKKAENVLLLSVLWLISLLPFPIIYALSDGLAFVLYHVIKYRKRVVFDNLSNSFPEKSHAEIKAIAKKFYTHFADLMLEIIKMISMSETEILKRVKFKNWDECLKIPQSGRGLLGVVGHYGNWEWAGLCLGLVAKPFPVYIIYKPLNEPLFNDYFNKIRERTHVVMLAMNKVTKRLVALRNNPYLLIFAADQSPQLQADQYETTFLNQRTFVYEGTARIARMADAPIMFGDIQRVKRGYYEMNVEIIVQEPSELTVDQISRIHVEKLEAIIRKKPEDWLWSHKRWKYSQR